MQGSFSSNSTIKINGGGTFSTFTGTAIYTTTASEYVIISIMSASNIYIGSYTCGTSIGQTFYVPPSTSFGWSSGGGALVGSYVRFANSP